LFIIALSIGFSLKLIFSARFARKISLEEKLIAFSIQSTERTTLE
jgi:hypothetical protein